MAPTSVIPFQHFLPTNNQLSSSPTTSNHNNSPAALFASSPFDNRDHFLPHHSSSTHRFPPQHHHHHTNAPSPHPSQLQSPSTPRDTYNDSARLGYPTNNRWDPSPNTLDDVSRGASSIPPYPQQQQQQNAFTLPPIVPPNSANANNNNNNTATPRTAGPEWDSTSAQYAAAAQWGAYTTSPGSWLFTFSLYGPLFPRVCSFFSGWKIFLVHDMTTDQVYFFPLLGSLPRHTLLSPQNGSFRSIDQSLLISLNGTTLNSLHQTSNPLDSTLDYRICVTGNSDFYPVKSSTLVPCSLQNRRTNRQHHSH